VSVFDETPAEGAVSRTPLVVGGLVALLVAGAAIWMLSRESDERPTTTAAPATPARSAPPAPAATAAAEPASTPAPDATARRPAAKAAAEPATAPVDAAPRADAATLVVESDVPGASVFVDREFVGTAPVTLKNLAAGSKRVNLSVEGFEGISRTIELAPGEQTVTMRFKEVRLNATTNVAHKHGVGGCQGTLRATVDGLAYETCTKSDAFTLRYDQVESFEVNYLEKNLRVKQRGGKTWNFTDRDADNADRLFVFHRDVQAARDKLAKGFAAAR
jgi:hypothetical protein